MAIIITLLRCIAVAIFAVVMIVFGCGYMLFSPRNPKHVFMVGRAFGAMHRVFGIKLELQLPENAYQQGQKVYIANHQNNWDMFTISSAVTPNVVTVGKKSLLWIPLLGLVYWLSGNILIDRNNRSSARGTIGQVIDKMKNSNMSVWMFPEGTRSRGRGLLPFKMGAFHTAVGVDVDIVPIVCSSTSDVRLGKWNNGHVIIKMLPPVSIKGYDKSNLKELAAQCHDLMEKEIALLNEEVERRHQSEKVTP